MNDASQIAPARRPDLLPEQRERAREPLSASEMIAWFADCDCSEQKGPSYCDHYLRYLYELESRGEVNDVDAYLRSRASARARRKRNVQKVQLGGSGP